MIQLMLEIVGVWLIAILMGMPLFASMGLAAFAFVAFSGLSPSIVPQKMAQAMNSFPIVAAPLFILMGNILSAARITDRIVSFATAVIGPIIPPSLPMVIFGVTADASIGRLFMAGVIPGVLMGLSLMVMVALVAKR